MIHSDLNRLAVFVSVAEAGGFTAAAERLGIAKSQVSHQIARLEKELGIELFSRSTRRVAMTDAGEQLYNECAPALAALDNAVADLDSGNGHLRGRLRITAPSSYAQCKLARQIAEFSQLHPGLDIDIVATDEYLDLIAEGIDIAIRVGNLKDSSLHATQLGSFRIQLAASPQLLDSYGPIAHPADLQNAPWVVLSTLQTPLTWAFTGPRGEQQVVQGRSVFRTNNTEVSVQAAIAGSGFVVAPDYLIQPEVAKGRLSIVCPSWTLSDRVYSAVYPASRQPPAKVRALVNWLKAHC
ncbi:LysR family transcriptional regulator [Parachitinimonas caeni]|uniref:LysR family transcriptional regulator n=1 Tax=Parachitinimonas caeni TaxID=3031301 RepID=A0ABT7DTK7_9NEIS|nr:LysR family transcriptional regulator [Parachitinimonas caeni]MDK2123390.1 LysR family transcriptional regulator [Parachitinimonas caeni]